MGAAVLTAGTRRRVKVDVQGPTGSRSSPLRRALACESAKLLGEVSLISESTGLGDLTERQFRRKHQALRALEAATRHVAMRRIPEARAEYAAEMKRAELG